jgi:hypothetical protein
MFVIGSGHRIHHNQFRRLNLAKCVDQCVWLLKEPDMLRTGIYFTAGAERPAITRNNAIEDNEISGFNMQARCVGFAPNVPRTENRQARNRCRTE